MRTAIRWGDFAFDPVRLSHPVGAGDDLTLTDLTKGCLLRGDTCGICRAFGRGRTARVAVLGGSVTKGAVQTCESSTGNRSQASCPQPSEAWPAVFGQLLRQAGVGVEVRNFAKGGTSITDAPRELQHAEVARFRPHVVVLAYASNDANAHRFFSGPHASLRSAAANALRTLAGQKPRPAVIFFDEFAPPAWAELQELRASAEAAPLSFRGTPTDAEAQHLEAAMQFNVPLLVNYRMAAWHRYVAG